MNTEKTIESVEGCVVLRNLIATIAKDFGQMDAPSELSALRVLLWKIYTAAIMPDYQDLFTLWSETDTAISRLMTELEEKEFIQNGMGIS